MNEIRMYHYSWIFIQIAENHCKIMGESNKNE
jgi:hypothetical protein